MTPAQATFEAMETIKLTAKAISDSLVGRKVRVTSDHNGQPYGRSKKSWKDEVCTIKAVIVDVDDGVQLQLVGHEYECFIPANEVELV